jgi:hypothetical protein
MKFITSVWILHLKTTSQFFPSLASKTQKIWKHQEKKLSVEYRKHKEGKEGKGKLMNK